MVQRGENLSFAFEAGEPVRIEGEHLWQNLERDVAIEFGVARAIDLSHAPRTDSGEDFTETN
jgi:hypothetical protein